METVLASQSPLMGGYSYDFVEIWHAHRGPVLLVVLSILLAVRVYLHLNEPKNELVAFQEIYGADPKKQSTAATTAGVDEKKREAATRAADAEKKDITAVAAGSRGPRRIKGGLANKSLRGKKDQPSSEEDDAAKKPIKIFVFFSSVTTKTQKLAEFYVSSLTSAAGKFTEESGRHFLEPELRDLSEIDFDDYFVSLPKPEQQPDADMFYLLLVPSYNIDTINDTFMQHLEETHHDFRIDTAPLSPLLGYSVFGFGDKENWPTEAEGFCFQAKETDRWMAKLTARKRAYPLGMGDMKSDHVERFAEWANGVQEVLVNIARVGNLGEGVPGSGEAAESDAEDVAEDEDDGEVIFEDQEEEADGGGRALDDVEDLGKMVRSDDKAAKVVKAPLAVDFTTYGGGGASSGAAAKKTAKKSSQAPPIGPKEMVAKNSPTYTALTKQGYAIVGSHSGVKICRWTKSALRGRGSCYKFSLYGINSHQCMETTPSLSCSNKCVFCWRHGTNPVGTTWRWVVDPPELIFEGVKENHYKKIKMMRGVPGVRAERFSEALRIRHCALSLVGEPIFYPYINEFLGMLHAERISSFLVCNAQHPDQLASLKAVTQLYVSIDASNRESLRRVDRPLHRDFWERFERCLDILREKRFRHRTVYRFTLVKGFNVDDEAEGYARLVERGLPCFVEVKGVTYCGTATSSNAGLTMGNVPFYWEVCDFVRALNAKLEERGLDYGIAAEHAHSCCILLASRRFNVDGKWHTHIDYDRFFELLEERGPDGDWTPEDYMGPPTPEWALWGNGGFDPRDDRVDRKGRRIEPVVVRDRPDDAMEF
ncbi:tRNA wybutosine-synthesizing protein 1 [Geosmithia morbida]|uniref:tRNA 4-demethylwyosine synthase (AdoMet-dependent) n=1 Tax=Geosmithia morbida TaxID=1094350 RepID=A0A9P4Z271_9HYPO|nr:tRNA wybutosine-synthesizing protein 1 [Geosmithia morbida]KAF4126807.1 tRNA wybutosine-synthesizing protein 1 [Geosmithia morbida]